MNDRDEFDELRKAYFKKIFEEAGTKDGIIDNGKLLTVIKNRKDLTSWESLMDTETKDKVYEIISKAYILENVKKLPTPVSRERRIIDIIEGKGGNMMVRRALLYNAIRTMGAGKVAVADMARSLLTNALKRGEQVEAIKFFSGADPRRFKEGLKAGFSAAASETAQGLRTPGISGIRKDITGTLKSPALQRQVLKVPSKVNETPPPGVNPLTP